MTGPPFRMTDPTVDIGVVCSDFDACVAFYQEALGLEVFADLQIPDRLAVPSGLAPSGFRHLRLRAGNTLIKLMEIEPPPPRRVAAFDAGVRWLTIRVEDLNGTIAELRSRGVHFLSDRLEGQAGAFACAQAPDGVLIEFVELYRSQGQALT